MWEGCWIFFFKFPSLNIYFLKLFFLFWQRWKIILDSYS